MYKLFRLVLIFLFLSFAISCSSESEILDTDTDSDGISDKDDNCPLILNADQLDTDSDTQGNECDTDDDNDGVADTIDDFPLDATETLDTDGDGIGNNADTDDDNDEVADTIDDFPLDATETLDTDGDGIGNNADTDDDNDGLSDTKEILAGSNPLISDRMSVVLNGVLNNQLNLNHACSSLGGGNQIPSITIENLPNNATNWVVFFEKNNQNCSGSECLNWVVGDISVDTLTLSSELDVTNINNIYVGNNYIGEANYIGPCDLGNDTYTMKIFALNTSTSSSVLELFNSRKMEELYPNSILDIASSVMSFDLSLYNSAPIANAGLDKIALVGGNVLLNSNLSTDPDNDILTYSWTLVNKPILSNAILMDSELAISSFVPDELGDYELQLTVSDGVWAPVTDNVTITVKPPIEVKFYYSTGVNITDCSLSGEGIFDGYKWYFIDCNAYTYPGTKLNLEIVNNSSSDVIINTLNIDYPTGLDPSNNMIGTGLEYLSANTTKSLVLTIDLTRMITGTIVTINTDVFGDIADEWNWFY